MIRTKRNIIFFTIPLLSGLLYLLAFYPGILSYDSIFQWDQAVNFRLNNWHPAYHTIIFWALTRIWASPAVLALAQILVFSLVVTYGLSTFHDLGVPLPLLIGLDLVMAFIPLNGMMMVTLWKDVLYGFAVLLLTIYILKITLSRGAWLTIGLNAVWLGVIVSQVALLRHNGFPVAYGTLIFLLLFIPQRKALAASLLVSIILAGFVLGPLYQIFKVDKNNTQPAGVVFLHPLAAHVHNGTPVTAAEKVYLDRIFPLDMGWAYSCYDATVFISQYIGSQRVNFLPVQHEPLTAARLLGRLTLDSPWVTLKHFACLSSFVWSPVQPAGVQLETVYLTNQDPISANPDWQPYASVVTRSSKLPVFEQWIATLVQTYPKIDPTLILWRPAVYLYLFIFSVIFYVYRRRFWLFTLLFAPVLLQSLIIALTTHLQSVRYQYPVYLVALLFAIPVIYLAGVRQTECAAQAGPLPHALG